MLITKLAVVYYIIYLRSLHFNDSHSVPILNISGDSSHKLSFYEDYKICIKSLQFISTV